jgi:hypothetical protein
MNNASRTNIACPFLGLRDDADSSLAFPSNSNYCYRSQLGSPVQYNHQAEFCLSEKHHECPLFLRGSQQAEITSRHLRVPRRYGSKTKFRRNLAIALGALIVVFALGWGIMRQRAPFLGLEQIPQPVSESAFPTATATPTRPPTMTASLASPTLTPTPTLHVPFFESVTVTQTPTRTVTPLPTLYISKHQLDLPIGTERKFIIHRISSGERLEPYAEKHKTNVAAIMAINYYLYLTNPVWSDALLIIPIGFADVSGLPVFSAYQVKEDERGVNFEYLARKFKVSLADFKNYNGINAADDRPLVGDLYLAPLPRRIP